MTYDTDQFEILTKKWCLLTHKCLKTKFSKVKKMVLKYLTSKFYKMFVTHKCLQTKFSKVKKMVLKYLTSKFYKINNYFICKKLESI